MTKKLAKMLSVPAQKKRKRKKKKKQRRVSARVKTLHRDIVMNVGEKRAMEILYDVIKFQGHKVPEIDLTLEDPASQFCINMYAEIADWDYKHLSLFIKEITGKPSTQKEIASLLGTTKSIFHALFIDEEDVTKAHLLRYDSKWKMWPKVRTSKRRKKMADSKLATRKKSSRNKASRKKASRKKVVAKKKGKRKAAKKAAKKTAAFKPKTRGLTENSKIKVVKDSGTPKMANRKVVKRKVPPAGIKASTLIERTGCTLRTIDGMIQKGFFKKA